MSLSLPAAQAQDPAPVPSPARTAVAAIALAAVAGYMVGIWLELPWLKLATKPFPVLAMAYHVRRTARDRYATWILLGLLFGLAGDMLLELGAALFIPGLVAFLIGHLLYVAAYVAHSRRLHLAAALPCGAYGAAMYVFLYPDLGGLAIPVAAYTLTICTMAWRAAAKAADDRSPGLERWVVLLGSILFVASDSLLAINKFHAPIPYSRYAIMLLYWAGQLGITLSVRPAPSASLTPPRAGGA